MSRARQRLGIVKLLPDSSIRAGGRIYKPADAPYLKWCLVGTWHPRGAVEPADQR